MVSSTIVAPGGTSWWYEVTVPPTATLTPIATATANVAAKLRVSCWAAATGTTMSALTSSRPTTRIATDTVTAAVTAVSRFRNRTGRPVTRANSSSWLTAKSCRRRPTVTSTTNAASTQIAVTSDGETVVRESRKGTWTGSRWSRRGRGW